MNDSISIETNLALVSEIVTLQSSSSRTSLISSYDQRVDALNKLSKAISTHSEAIAQALFEDLGQRSVLSKMKFHIH